MDQSKRAVFLHIPKAGGTTLRRITERQYDSGEIVTLTEGPERQIEELKKLSVERLGQVRLIRGHVCFGIHEYFDRPVTYFTVLREPVDRVVSLYWYLRQAKDNPKGRKIIEEKMDLAYFVESGMVQAMNHQTRLISGQLESVDGALEKAKQNLDRHFAVAGVADRFDETLLLLKQMFNWKHVYYHRRNVTENRPLRSDIPDSVIRLIEMRNELDTELYRYVSRRLEVELNRKTTVQADVIRFRKINRWYGIPGTIMDRIRRVLPESVKRLVRRLPGFGRFLAGN